MISSFQYTQTLSSDSQAKQVAFLGTIDGQKAIVSLEKSHFGDFSHDIVSETELIENNDVYHWYKANLCQDLAKHPGAKLNVIYPATETHIKKYSKQEMHYIMETPEMYRQHAVPYIQSMKGDRIKWVYNILFDGKESETFVYHDKDPETGFVLLPDMKWDRMNLASLYLVCIVNRMDISSVRDLNGSHLGFLERLQATIKEVASEKFGIEKSKLRLFVHYHPSYYHFHIHVVNVSHSGLKEGINVGKAILLDDVIENIRLVGDYYERRVLGVVLGENHGLWERYKPVINHS